MKRILLIGVGRWGINHLRVLKSMPVELFIADHHEQRLNSVDIPQSHRSTDARSLFSKVDAAVVVTPAPAHFETCSELLEMGKDVFVEKPITLASSEAKKLTELAEKAGLILQVGHIFRFDPASLWMRDAIVEHQFGRLKMLQARFSGFKRPRQDTGVTFADSIHFIDLFNFLRGVPPRRVHAVLGDFFGRGMDDESLIVLEYYQGNGSPILATIEAGYHTPGKFREVTIMETRSSAVCDYNVAQYKIRTFANQHVADGEEIKAEEGAVHQLEFPPEEPLRAELAAFIDAIEKRRSRPVDGWAGFHAVRVVEAALESARTGNWITIDNLNEHRRRVAARYAERLCGIVKTPPEKKWAYAVYHMYVIQTERRDELVRHLQSKGIGTGIHYPVANHQQPAIAKIYGDLPRLPNTEAAVKEILSLPIYGELPLEDVDYVSDAIVEFFAMQ